MDKPKNRSPISYRKPAVMPDGKEWAAITMKLLPAPIHPMPDDPMHPDRRPVPCHFIMQGSIDDPKVQKKLRKQLAKNVYSAIINDEWNA